MKRIISTIVLLAAVSAASFAQNEAREKFSPKAGDYSVGININPMAASAFKFQPKAGEFAGTWINSIAANPEQMFYISPNSLLAVQVKYMLSSKTALKASIGFSGSYISYKEYIDDDARKYYDPASQAQTVDALNSKVNGGSLVIGLESMLGKGSLKFTVGGSIAYAIGGGVLDFKYGNGYDNINGFKPTTSSWTTAGAEGSLNEYDVTKKTEMGFSSVRPLRRYNMGACQSLGLLVDLGLEWFFYENFSCGAKVSVLPLLVNFQPQTYSVYEGYSNFTKNIETDNLLVSPGSIGLNYGLDNLGVNLSLNYWF